MASKEKSFVDLIYLIYLVAVVAAQKTIWGPISFVVPAVGAFGGGWRRPWNLCHVNSSASRIAIRAMWPRCPWLFQTRKFRRFRFWCVL